MESNNTFQKEEGFITLDRFEDWVLSKFLAVIFSILTVIIFVPMLGSVVMYENNCHNRTLVNRLIASNIFTIMAWNLTVQPIVIFRYLAGPNSYTFCQFEYLLKNVMSVKVPVFITFISILRYIFLSHAKNPTAIQDDFWTLFLEIWTIGFATICQLVTVIYPSREPTMLYICYGKFPKKFLNQKVKSNASFNVVVLLAIIMHIALSARYMVYKIKEKKDYSQQQNTTFSLRTYFKEKMNSESLFSLTSNFAKIAITVVSGALPAKINSIDPKQLNDFPNYLFVYAHHFILIGGGTMTVVFTYYFKNRQLWPFHKRQCIEFYKSIKEKLNLN